MKIRRSIIVLGALAVLLAVLIAVKAPGISWVVNRIQGENTVGDRLAEWGVAARSRLKPAFEASSVHYPPDEVVYVVLKKERMLQVYASLQDGDMHFIRDYPILGASGKLGPKLREDDIQVPEGIYKINYLNPNSAFHLSMRLDYPNEFDRKIADLDGRRELGQDIMIHGGRASIGCVAMGDQASEELFVLTADTGVENVKVILSPVDFRRTELKFDGTRLPKWTSQLYADISDELNRLPLPD